jgi:hypothetical protein
MKELMDQLEKGSASGGIDSWFAPQLAASLSAATSLMEGWRGIQGLRLDPRLCVQERRAAKHWLQ